MNIAICDDEEFYVQDISTRLDNFTQTFKDIPLDIDTFTSGKDLIKSFTKKKYDLIYLDIELADSNGIDIAQYVHDIKPNCMIIFVTSHMSYVNQSFIVNAFQFIKKPIKSKLFIEEIISLETSYKYYKLYSTHGNYYGNSKSIQTIKKDLEEFYFFRIQRSHLINLSHIKEIQYPKVIMSNGSKIKVSKKRYKDFKKAFNKFLDQ